MFSILARIMTRTAVCLAFAGKFVQKELYILSGFETMYGNERLMLKVYSN